MIMVTLTSGEMEYLDRQAPGTSQDCGFQSLLVRLQGNINRSTGELPLTEEDLDALACARMDQRIRTEKPIPIDQVLKEYGRRRPRVVGR